LAAQDEHCQRLMSVPGVGPIISSAVVAVIGTGAGFKQGRDFGAWLGLIPEQESTGDRTFLGKFSKRGTKSLRTLFIQAATSCWCAGRMGPGWVWGLGLRPRDGGCIATCW
jgi:transposase